MSNKLKYKNPFDEYYRNNKGIFYKSFETNINNIHNIYDIYWGNPEFIFYNQDIKDQPLALTQFSRWMHDPNTRIYLHEKIEKKYNNAFDFILTHEIGHIWLRDVLGINHPRGHVFIDNTESWADYFAYIFFQRYRNITNLEQFKNILLDCDNLCKNIYSISHDTPEKFSFVDRIQGLVNLTERIQNEITTNTQQIQHILYSLDLFFPFIIDILN